MKANLQKLYSLMLILTLALLTACASTGNSNLAKIKDLKEFNTSSIIKNKTTREDVEQLLGAPQYQDFMESGYEKWIYTHDKVKTKATNFIPIVSALTNGTDRVTKRLVIIFNKDGTVKNSTVGESKEETTGGWLD